MSVFIFTQYMMDGPPEIVVYESRHVALSDIGSMGAAVEHTDSDNPVERGLAFLELWSDEMSLEEYEVHK